jgi:hypothetical protein
MRKYFLIFALLATTTLAAYDLNENLFPSYLDVTSKSKTLGTDNIKGEVKINGEVYQAMCDCNDADQGLMDSLLLPKCDPSKFKLNEDKKGKGADFDEVRELIGYPTDLTYVNVDRQYFSCLDGRITDPILGTMGGDAGEFILGLEMYKEMIGTEKLDQATVNYLFISYLGYMQPAFFYMCTDDQALNHLQQELQLEGLDLHAPRAQDQAEILKALTKSENVGDLHIKLLLRYPDMYEIQVDLVEKFLVAYYTTLWNHEDGNNEKLLLQVLIGPHKESAFLEVRSNQACTSAKEAPLITPHEPSKDGLSIFVNHLDAASIRRVDIAKFFTEYIDQQKSGISPEMFHNRLDHHALAFLEVTGTYLARNLPFYTINII